MHKLTLCLTLALAGCGELEHGTRNTEHAAADAAFNKLSDQYISGYLAWRPQTGTTLGLHEYDGKITDFSAESLKSELERLKDFAHRLAQVDTNALSAHAFYDYRILNAAINREIFGFEQMRIYSRNPMTYAGAIDVSVYIKRNFAPLDQRVRSIISVLNQAPNIMAAAEANLMESLPRPEIETAVDQATGAADFLGKDLVAALKEVKEEKLMAEFNASNQRAIAELHGFATYLKEQKLPKANDNYALGRDKYMKLLEYGEMLTLSPEQLLDVGLRELKRKQQAFADAAKEIDPSKSPMDVFRDVQKDHPTEQSLIPDTARDLEMIRQYLLDHKIINLPSSVRAKVAETPQFLRATSFASMDTPGVFETKATDAYYYVTPVEPDWPPKQKEEWLTAFNYYTTDIVSIHEAYPGHYVQYLALNASSASRLEKIFGAYAFIEGWAHYTEQMMVDEGFGSQAPSREAHVFEPGDPIVVTFNDMPNPPPRAVMRVGEDGTITLVWNQTFIATGKTAKELDDEIRARYMEAIYHEVTITVSPFNPGEWPRAHGILPPVDRPEQIAAAADFTDFSRKPRLTRTSQTLPTANHDQSLKAAKYRLAQADEALLRVCRLCVSIKMHCQGMTVDEGTKFFQDNCYYEEKPARSEAIRGTFDPEYLYYTVGKLEIFKLRDDFRKQQGAAFSLQKFHDEILRHGAPPIRLLRELMLKDRKSWDEVL